MNVHKLRIGFAAGFAALVFAFSEAAWAQAPSLSLQDAAKAALAKDPGIQSAKWDWLSATAKAEAANWRKLPSASLTAGYTRLSELPSASTNIQVGTQTVPFSLPSGLLDMYTFGLNVQYPVFAGFRLREAAAIAELQAQGKQAAVETVKRALLFEVRRAYWEAVRATQNIRILRKNLELTEENRRITAQQFAQGAVTQADKLTADLRHTQADMDLGDAIIAQKRAFLSLAMLIGDDALAAGLSAGDAPPPLTLTTGPGDEGQPAFSDSLEENGLVSDALAGRPETRAMEISVSAARHGIALSQAPLYPTLSLTGNYTLANPNSRVFFQTDPQFTGTWALGIQLSYDLGGIPANLAERSASTLAADKAASDAEKQRNAVAQDVRACILNLKRARRDLELTRQMVEQATENARVARQRLGAGRANDLDVSTADLGVSRSDFAVFNREIDVQIASADLARAAARDELP